MHDALIHIVEIIQLDAELTAICPQGVDLLFGDGVEDRQRAVGGGDVMIGRGDGSPRPADFPAREPQTLEGLRTGHFVNELKIDVENRLLSRFGVDLVVGPNLFEGRSWRIHIG